MPFAVALLCHPLGTFAALVVAIVAALYAAQSQRFLPAFTAVSAALLALLAFLQVPAECGRARLALCWRRLAARGILVARLRRRRRARHRHSRVGLVRAARSARSRHPRCRRILRRARPARRRRTNDAFANAASIGETADMNRSRPTSRCSTRLLLIRYAKWRWLLVEIKKLPAAFYCTAAGNEPVRKWLKIGRGSSALRRSTWCCCTASSRRRRRLRKGTGAGIETDEAGGDMSKKKDASDLPSTSL